MPPHPADALVSRKAAAIDSSATLEVAALAARMKAQGKDVIAFAAGEPDLPVPADVNEAGVAAIRADRGRYTAAAGLPSLREAVAAKFRRDGFAFGADEVLCTAGAKPAIFEALFAVLNDGDEVLYPSPFWGSYTDLVKAAGGRPIPVPTDAGDDFQPRPERLRAALTPRSRALILNSPNNPTGTVYSRATLEGIAAIVRERGLVVISDDIYDCLVYTGEPYLNLLHVAPDLSDRILVCNSLSKSHSMTGWRLGYVGGPKPVIEAMSRLQSQIIGNPPTITQLAALTALSKPPDPARAASLDSRRRQLVSLLQEIPGLAVPVPRGAFYVFPSVAPWLGRPHRGHPVPDSASFSRRLLDDQLVATIPGEAFGAAGHIRFTYTVSAAEIAEGVRRFRSFLSGFDA